MSDDDESKSNGCLLVTGGGLVLVTLSVPLLLVSCMGIVQQSQPEDSTSSCTVTANSSGVSTAIPEEYQDLVHDAADEAGLPVEVVAAQLNQESQWDPNATSPVGAEGIGQFMPETWDAYGEGGDPRNPDDAIPAYGRYMADLKEQVQPIAGDDADELVRLTLAAYNAGPGAVQEHDGVPPFNETQDYVTKILDGGQSEFSADCEAPSGGKAWDGDLGDGEWTNPLPGGQFTSGYGRRDISGVPEWAKDHMGVDISTGAGSGPGGDVLAPADMEIVEFYEPDACIKGKQKDEPYFYFNLCHLAENYVEEGDEVTRGDVIGVEGNTGQISGMATHLHVEIFKPDSPSPPQPYNGSNIDPEPILKEKGAWPE